VTAGRPPKPTNRTPETPFALRTPTIEWELRQEGEWTIILFRHLGWAEPVEFMHHCSTKWATFLLSLKTLLETGQGVPAPDDLVISDWH